MKILLGFAGTDQSMRALEKTLERVRGTGDELTIALFETPEGPDDVDEFYAVVEECCGDAGVDFEVRELEGDPGSSIVTLAEQEGFDRIVMGGGETSPMGKIRLGPTTEFVLLNATTTVTLVR
ncbi:MAG TPA: universal stress protein [Natrialbaceae archaeon]|nr:universal stress protein [Natrialbaceae archaeon]